MPISKADACNEGMTLSSRSSLEGRLVFRTFQGVRNTPVKRPPYLSLHTHVLHQPRRLLATSRPHDARTIEELVQRSQIYMKLTYIYIYTYAELAIHI